MIETIGPVNSPRPNGLPTDNPSGSENWLRLGRSQKIRPGAIFLSRNEPFELKHSFGITMKNKSHEKVNHAVDEQAQMDKRRTIETRAYYLWLEDGASHGNSLLHWLQAEREFEGQYSPQQAM